MVLHKKKEYFEQSRINYEFLKRKKFKKQNNENLGLKIEF